jgi:Flp pilus assembly protein TadB
MFSITARRFKLFTEQFPDAIDMMTNALRAGHAFVRALQLVATELRIPLAWNSEKLLRNKTSAFLLRKL